MLPNSFILTMHTDNDAFRPNASNETARLLREIAEQIEGGLDGKRILDINGNTIGEWFFSRQHKFR